MARNRRKATPDADGWLSTGIYSQYVGPPSELTAEEWQRLRNERKSRDRSLKADLGHLRQWLRDIILPHVEGPLQAEQADPETGLFPLGDDEQYVELDFGDGLGSYRAKADLEPTIVDALAALELLQPVKKCLAGDADRLYRAAFELGRLCERIQVRPFESLVITAKLRLAASAKGGKATAKWNKDVERMARKIFSELKVEKVSDDAAYRRTAARLKAEHGVSLSKDTLKRQLSKPSAQR